MENEINLEQAQAMLQDASSVNLDEVSAETVSVAFREFVADKAHGYKVRIEHYEISTFVPMFLLNRMLANQKKAQLLRARFKAAQQNEATDEDLDAFFAEPGPLDIDAITDSMFADILRNSEPMLIWQAKEVLGVWQLTQPNMTLKRLLLGLDFEKINGLFSRFFGVMLLQKKSKA